MHRNKITMFVLAVKALPGKAFWISETMRQVQLAI